jgi:hypothetical protein
MTGHPPGILTGPPEPSAPIPKLEGLNERFLL